MGMAMLDLGINWDDPRTGRPVYAGNRSYPGLTSNPSFTTYIGQNLGSPAWQGLNGSEYYYHNYGTPIDPSHMPSLWIMNYIRTGHPFWEDAAVQQCMGLFQSNTWKGYQDSTGRTYDFNILKWGDNGAIQTRVTAWTLRQFDMADVLVSDAHPMQAVVRDIMDETEHYASIFESECQATTVNSDGADRNKTMFLPLGIVFVLDGQGIAGQTFRPYMNAYLALVTFQTLRRGERLGFKPFCDIEARWFAVAYGLDANGCGMLDYYSLTIQDAAGSPAYADWRTIFAKNGVHGYTNPAQNYPAPTSPPSVGASGSDMFAAVAACAAASYGAQGGAVMTPEQVWIAANGISGQTWLNPSGVGYYGGYPFAATQFAICPENQAAGNP